VYVSPQRLQEVLAERYRIEHELGRGGMASVFLAEDLKHHRKVAIKVLHPETAAAIGADRFLREIEIAAGLTHPNILPLHDSGTAGDLLYYVMPYVAGESLRDRLARGGPVPLEEALRIAREIAEALDYSHREGIVHRDIKPENVLLADGHVLLADFGIATAVHAARAPHLTRTGQVVGTPAYLSPEQATGSAPIDGRTDIYSLGCLLYEMLAGWPPFSGPTEEGVIFQHIAGHAPSLSSVRRAVPAAIASAVERAMAKTPRERFRTAADFAAALDTSGAVPGRTRVYRAMPWIGVVVAMAVVGGIAYRRAHAPAAGTAVAPDVVAVLPFRAAGPDVAYLGEGMVDLMAAKLTGEGGPRAIDPRTLMSAWNRATGPARRELSEPEIVRLCRGLGANQILTGSLVSAAGRLLITASWARVGDGRRLADITVQGHADSLAYLVDGLTSQLLARGAVRSDREVAALTSASLPALRRYVMGRAAYRRGQYREAVDHLESALQLDSTFTLAAVSLIDAAAWVSSGDAMARASNQAWDQRRRLSTRDRAYVEARLGPHRPWPSTIAERIAAWEKVIDAAPDQPETWYELGDVYFHGGPAAGIADARERARAAFQRAFDLDPTFVSPLDHLIELAVLARDTSVVRSLVHRYLQLDPGGERTDYLRWRSAVALGDRAAHEALVARMDSIDDESLWRILTRAQEDGIALEDALRADAILRRRAASASDQWNAGLRAWGLALNRGRPREALARLEAVSARAERPYEVPRVKIVAGLLWDGDSVAAARAVAVLAPELGRPLPGDPARRQVRCDDAGLVMLWSLLRGDRAAPDRFLPWFRTVAGRRPERPEAAFDSMWLDLVDAIIATRDRTTDASSRTHHLDSLLAAYPDWAWTVHANLVVAGLYEAQGDLRAALGAARRRYYNFTAPMLSTALREEGRLAARLGDRKAALRAYRHYLALQVDPEPSLAPRVAQVHAEMGLLERPPGP
jgi:tetratricopeptide (TPR) repeat protein